MRRYASGLAIRQAMQLAAQEPYSAFWRVTREGNLVATIDIHEEGALVVVAVTVESITTPYEFASPETADTFLQDLTTSFAYLGCELEHAPRVTADVGTLSLA